MKYILCIITEFLFVLQPIYLNAHFKYSNTASSYGGGESFSGMVATCKLAGTSCIREICVGTSFRTKHSLDLKYTFLDTRCICSIASVCDKVYGCHLVVLLL